jgi:hypothetical protein
MNTIESYFETDELKDFKKCTVNDLMNLDYLSFGYFTFVNRRLQDPTASDQRLKIARSYFKILANEIGVPFRKLSFYLKDEIAGGIDDHNGKGHIHYLLSFSGIEKLIEEYKCHTELKDYFTITSLIIKKFKKITSRYGLSKVSRYDYNKHDANGILYTAKTGKRKWNNFKNCFTEEILYSGFEHKSPALEKEIQSRKENFVGSTCLNYARQNDFKI